MPIGPQTLPGPSFRAMPEPGEAASGRPIRITALDRTRGFAVICMVLAHFGPGIYDRVGLQGTPRHVLDLTGRLATPMFVLIFGITLGIVYMPRAARDPAAVRRALVRRAGLVLLCSLVVVAPATIALFVETSERVRAFDLLLRQYSVLTFYAVAIFATGLACSALARDPWRTGLVAGATLVFAGSFLGYDAWPQGGETEWELLRLLFVSGKYGVFTLLGSAWLMLGLGVMIRRRVTAGEPFRQDLAIIALSAILIALSVGRVVGWRSIADLAQRYDAPPQLWFLVMAGGAMLIALAVLDAYPLGLAGLVLEHVGRNPLTIYLGHAFVLPAIALARQLAPDVPELVILGACVGGFLLFCAITVHRSIRKVARAGAAGPKKNPAGTIAPAGLSLS